MAKLILNSTVEVKISAFNKNISVYENNVTSTAYFQIDDSMGGDLEQLIGQTITSIVIKDSQENTIYTLNNANASISNLNVTLNGDVLSTDMNLTFNT